MMFIVRSAAHMNIVLNNSVNLMKMHSYLFISISIDQIFTDIRWSVAAVDGNKETWNEDQQSHVFLSEAILHVGCLKHC